MIRRTSLLFAVMTLVALSAAATTFVVPKDRHLVGSARMIVTGRVETSFTQLTEAGGIETVTSVVIEEVLKGSRKPETIKVYAPGGEYDDRGEIVVAAPRFQNGERVILFLNETAPNRFVVLDLALGKFTRAKASDGKRVAVRNDADITGWTIDGAVHHERWRDEAKFIDFIRNVVSGAEADDEGYFVPEEKSEGRETGAQGFEPVTLDFTASSYLFSANARWSSFPRNFTNTNTIPNAPGGGNTAIANAMGLWNNDAQSNVSYVHTGADATKVGGIFTPDSANAVRWEIDLTSIGAPAFSCSSGGVLGVAQIRYTTSQGQKHSGPGGTLYNTITEGDVDMNQGQNACNNAFLSGNTFQLGLTHEFGHTLGFRHGDENPDGSACTAPNECVPAPPVFPNPDNNPITAVMRSSIRNGLSLALLAYDQNAVRTVYPLSVVTPPAAPTGLSAAVSGPTSIGLTWSAVSGATSYKIFRRATIGSSFAQVGVSATNSFPDSGLTASTAYQYMVRATNDGGDSTDSNTDFTTTMVYAEAVASGVTVKLQHFTEMRTAVNAVRTLANLSAFNFSAPAPATTVTVRKAHIDDLRTALNAARTALGAGTISFAETLTAQSTTVKASHITEIRNGVY